MIEMGIGGLANKVRGIYNYFFSSSSDKPVYTAQPLDSRAIKTESFADQNINHEETGRIEQIQGVQTSRGILRYIPREEADMVLPTGRNIADLISALASQGYEAKSVHVASNGTSAHKQIAVDELSNYSTEKYADFILMFGQNEQNIAYLQLSKGRPGWKDMKKSAFFDYMVGASGEIDSSSKKMQDFLEAIRTYAFNYPKELVILRGPDTAR